MSLSLIISQLAQGMVVSVEIFFLTLLFSLPLGLVVCFGRMSRFAPLRLLSRFFISVLRGTPLMLQLMVVYYGPFYLFGIQIGQSYRFAAVIIGFVINYAAYFAEIYRSGIESMPRGQYEAASVLGYSRGQCFFKIILPQVVKRILPPVTNEIITLVKDTSLAFAISIPEMFTAAQAIAAAQRGMTAFIAAGVFYYVFNLIVDVGMGRVERALNYYR